MKSSELEPFPNNKDSFRSKMPRTDWQFIGGIAVTHPVLSKQSDTVLLDHMNRRINYYTRASQFLIREYCAHHICDVVAGKLDIRGIGLPATSDTDVPQEYSSFLYSEAVMECDEPQEHPAEGD